MADISRFFLAAAANATPANNGSDQSHPVQPNALAAPSPVINPPLLTPSQIHTNQVILLLGWFANFLLKPRLECERLLFRSSRLDY